MRYVTCNIQYYRSMPQRIPKQHYSGIQCKCLFFKKKTYQLFKKNFIHFRKKLKKSCLKRSRCLGVKLNQHLQNSCEYLLPFPLQLITYDLLFQHHGKPPSFLTMGNFTTYAGTHYQKNKASETFERCKLQLAI